MMKKIKELVLEDVDDRSNQNNNNGSINHTNNEHQTNKMKPVNPDLLDENQHYHETIQADKHVADFPEENTQNQEEVASSCNIVNEWRKQEIMRIMDMNFPEFKLKSDEFFQNIAEWADPQCYEGIKETQRLNRILSEKIEKEKEVKRQGMLLRQKLYEELQAIKQQGRQEQQEERANTQKFLALTFLPEKKKFIDENPESDTELKPDLTSSVFQTELKESDIIPKSNENNSVPELDLISSETIDHAIQRNTLPEMLDENGSCQLESKHKVKKNFLKRNIQLLKDANSAVPMTANEKKRIEVLLQDLDVFFDHDQDIESNCSWNVSSMNCPLGDGFTSSNEDKALLNLIDSKLKSLMSGDEFNSVASTQRSTSTQRAFTCVVPPSDTEALKSFGEKALLDSKEERAMKERLKKIDKELVDIYNDPLLNDSFKVDENVLLELLESCASSMSGCVSDHQAISDVEASSSPHFQEVFMESDCINNTARNASISKNLALLMESPPYLSEAVLQRLLEDATQRNSCVISTLQSNISSRSGTNEEYKEDCTDTGSMWHGDFYYTTERSSLNSSMQEHFLPEISSSRSLVEVDNTS